MIVVSHTWRFIYIRVPRTGSTTYCHYLSGCFGDDVSQVGPQHETAKQALIRDRRRWEAYRTYGFIRSPWTWLVSLFHSGVSAQAGDTVDHWQGNQVSIHDHLHRSNMDFDEFVRQRKTSPVDWLCDGDRILVDKVLRFEDFVGLNGHWKLHANETKRKVDIDQWYTPDLSAYVAERFQRDIELGQYEPPEVK